MVKFRLHFQKNSQVVREGSPEGKLVFYGHFFLSFKFSMADTDPV